VGVSLSCCHSVLPSLQDAIHAPRALSFPPPLRVRARERGCYTGTLSVTKNVWRATRIPFAGYPSPLPSLR